LNRTAAGRARLGLARLVLALALAAVSLLRLSAGLSGQNAAGAPSNAPDAKDTIPAGSYRSFSPFPILMYDTDIGFGYGGRVKFVDYLRRKESLDLILFNSTKGERWYVFTFSIPDFEIRQGRRYGLSFDLKAEYDKFLNYGFYGLGADAPKSGKTVFAYETISLPLVFGRGLSRRLAVEAAYALRWTRYSDPLEGGAYFDEIAGLAAAGRRFAPFASFTLRYDTSDSQIHPTRGLRLILRDDASGRFLGGRDASFNRVTLDLRLYRKVFGAKDVFAIRALTQYVGGRLIPLFDLSALGGDNPLTVLRGYPLNRFLDRGKFLVNAEYRFPVVWRLGANVFCDAGKVWHSLGTAGRGPVAFDAGLGLRFYMPDFVARVDVAWSVEGMGLYFNFGHVF
jgi:outer membrane protein assembly factor BamA